MSEKRLKFYKLEQGVRKPVHIWVDKDMVITRHEGLVDSIPERAMPQDPVQRAASVGIFTEVDPITGALVITGLDEKAKSIMPFFSESQPCWFPECAGLRARYLAEKRALEAGDEECKPCVIGDLNRKYMAILRRLSIPPP